MSRFQINEADLQQWMADQWSLYASTEIERPITTTDSKDRWQGTTKFTLRFWVSPDTQYRVTLGISTGQKVLYEGPNRATAIKIFNNA